jgi:mannose-6-phosphate isomerase
MAHQPLTRPVLLESKTQPYAWGSRTALSSLRGEAPTAEPEAELWIGAHPFQPSLVNGLGLDVLIGAAASDALGATAREQFGDELPFLLKVLAADAPLSLQAHPTKAQAEAGFSDEDARGVLLTAPNRVFKDRNHKPELLCALTDFEALCGFRPVDKTAVLLEALATPTTIGMAARLRADHPALAIRSIVVQLLSLNAADASPIVNEVVDACAAGTGPFAEEYFLVTRLAQAYPGDVGAIISLLMNHVVLRPGQALVLAAGNLHAYIQGVGVELMANSDNVLRCGLTPKHVDVPGLLQVLDWNPLADPVAEATGNGPVYVYPSPSAEFSLQRIDVDGDLLLHVEGPELLWCHHGPLHVEAEGSLMLAASASAFVPAATGSYRVQGHGSLFRATVGPPV